MTPRELEKLMKGFANRRRLTMLSLLEKEKELNVSEISQRIKLSYKSTSQHLLVLENAGLVRKRQESLAVFYFLSNRHRGLINLVLQKLK